MEKGPDAVLFGERYIPNADHATALGEADRLRLAVTRLAGGGLLVRSMSTTFVPNVDWAFDLFEADSADQVERVYEDSTVAVERVTEGVPLPGP